MNFNTSKELELELFIRTAWLSSYLWLVGNGGMGYNYSYYYYHSSIPY